MTMSRICHILDELGVGGLEQNVVKIALGLDRGRFYQEVWCLKSKGDLARGLEKEGVIVRDFGFKGRITLGGLILLSRELKKGSFTIVHAHDLYPASWAVPAAFLAGVKARLVHCQNTYSDLSLKNRLRMRGLCLFSSACVAVSKAVRRSLVEDVGLDCRKIRLIYNCAEEIKKKDVDEAGLIRSGLRLSPHDFVVGAAGRLIERKGYKYLIEALAPLKKDFPDIKCLLIGDGPQRQDLQSLVSALGLADEVIFTGLRHDISALYSAMDIFVQPSLVKEGLPLSLLEAASSGLPLIATDIGGNPEAVKDGLNGFIVPSGDAGAIQDKIRLFLERPDMAGWMGENSRDIWRERFRLEDMLKKVEVVYSERKHGQG